MTGRTIAARCRHNLGRRVEPIAPTLEPVEPAESMSGREFVTRHPDLARALARLAASGEEQRRGDRD